MDREQLRNLIERLVREELAKLQSPISQPANPPGARRLIAADEVEAAVRTGNPAALDARGALITPLARDRARELGLKLLED